MEFRVVVYISLAVLVLCHVSRCRACDITHECPNDSDVVWATDGTACHVFHNRCFLENVNCHHMNNNVHQLEEIPKDVCQKLCVTQCPVDDNPVCGYFNDTKHTYANQCEMEAHICLTGEPLFVYGIGPCD